MRYEEYVKMQLDLLNKEGIIDKEKIPRLKLYMDQVENFFKKQTEGITDETNKWYMTKSMISNYTKYNIVPRSEGKKYTRDHLLMLTMVLYLRGIFKIDDMEYLMNPLVKNYNSEFDETINPEILYGIACKINEEFMENFSDSVNCDMKNLKKLIADTDIADDERAEVLILILSLAMKADMEKLLAMKLLNEYFIGPEKEKKKKIANKKVKAHKSAVSKPEKKSEPEKK